ncbi:unnamed protein product [Microthlaspi erraticum]|uniref:Uncharacterized protein n=1 Tax=Microthlaspi erraticum TaxID=1685480 RepID=A0A6D2J1G9_9BRAS|nr:unnamed protein product [Microthlaspi erraticum]
MICVITVVLMLKSPRYWLGVANGSRKLGATTKAMPWPLSIGSRVDGEDKGCREGRDGAVWRIFEPDWFGYRMRDRFAARLLSVSFKRPLGVTVAIPWRYAVSGRRKPL